MKLHNSLGRVTQDFEPLSPGFAGVYVCGPTVYGHSHLGHAKSYVSFDVLVRLLRRLGLRVRYVQNITDVGHLVDNSEFGEDKIQRQAALERAEPMELAEMYTRSYFEDMDALGNLRPDISPRASGHIPEQIDLAARLLETGHAYESAGNVYFSVRSFRDYGRLSGKRTDDLLSGIRVEAREDKRDPLDFALWKRADQGHILRWNSPWGPGYPGWHLECSAMAMRYLGETIDIHCGGLENIFPHHESEIAQSEAASGRRFARFWLHNNMVTVDGRKMGKSLGNALALKDVFSRTEPMVVRLYILRSQYRSPLDISDEGLSSAASALERLRGLAARLGPPAGPEGAPDQLRSLVEEYAARFTSRLEDDLDTPGAVAELFDFVRTGNQILESGAGPSDRSVLAGALEATAGDLLGLDLSRRTGGTPQVLLDLVADYRRYMRSNRLYEEADGMRRRLSEAGFEVRDLPGGESRIERV